MNTNLEIVLWVLWADDLQGRIRVAQPSPFLFIYHLLDEYMAHSYEDSVLAYKWSTFRLDPYLSHFNETQCFYRLAKAVYYVYSSHLSKKGKECFIDVDFENFAPAFNDLLRAANRHRSSGDAPHQLLTQYQYVVEEVMGLYCDCSKA